MDDSCCCAVLNEFESTKKQAGQARRQAVHTNCQYSQPGQVRNVPTKSTSIQATVYTPIYHHTQSIMFTHPLSLAATNGNIVVEFHYYCNIQCTPHPSVQTLEYTYVTTQKKGEGKGE